MEFGLSRTAAILLCSGFVLASCAPDNAGAPSEMPEGGPSSPAPTSEDDPSGPDGDQMSSDNGQASPTSDEETEPVSAASDDPESIHVLVNKHHPLQPLDFVPTDLRTLEVPMQYEGQQMRDEAAAAMEEFFDAAAAEGVDLWVTTAYRDFGHQQALYDQRFAQQGQDATDELTARPGFSEHQTGLAADLSYPGNEDCYLSACFGETPQGEWVAQHAHEFGFVLRYPDGAADITGFSYEPWHLRYVGDQTAAELAQRNVTLEEYWGVGAAPDYDHDYGEDPASGGS